jgi:glycosyltransferase involved in cell wall biosynthesis
MTRSAKKQVWLEITHVLVSPTRFTTGVGYLTEELVRALLKRDATYDYTLAGNLLFTRPLNPILTETSAPRRLFRLLPGKVWNQLFKRHLLPPITWLLHGRPDAVVFFNFVRFPVSRGVRTLTFIHDLGFMVHPEFVAEANFGWLKHCGPSARQSTRVLTISEATKRDITKYFNVPAAKISVIYPGVDIKRFENAELSSGQRQRYGLSSDYFLYVGTLEPRKNLTGIIAAYRQLDAQLQRQHNLVLAGGKGWNDAEIWAAIKAYDGPGKIVTPGYIAAADVGGLYRGATAFVFPSHYEGFGMPVLEAMAAGTPVITATNSSLPEAAGEAALLVDATDSTAIAAAMTTLATDRRRRTALIAAGRRHVQQFTWENSAQQLEAAIDAAFDST